MPEAGAFFEGLLRWAAIRFGVAMALTIAGPTDNGEPEALRYYFHRSEPSRKLLTIWNSIYASGDVKETAPILSNFAAASFETGRLRLRQYARDCLTGDVHEGTTPAQNGETGGVAVDDADKSDEESDDDDGDYKDEEDGADEDSDEESDEGGPDDEEDEDFSGDIQAVEEMTLEEVSWVLL